MTKNDFLHELKKASTLVNADDLEKIALMVKGALLFVSCNKQKENTNPSYAPAPPTVVYSEDVDYDPAAYADDYADEYIPAAVNR